ncbi:hypothetical protein VNO80_07845 [Phaseolus coccineus]|uniref:Uncharacterized protein n=1 Tax=Phaseolus coccineus TaxID=3886 RepID=A0AAN9NJT8_PHACN
MCMGGFSCRTWANRYILGHIMFWPVEAWIHRYYGAWKCKELNACGFSYYGKSQSYLEHSPPLLKATAKVFKTTVNL